MKKLLLYGVNGLRDFKLIAAMQSVGSAKGFSVVTVPQEQYALPLEAVLDGGADRDADKTDVPAGVIGSRMLVFADFDRAELFEAIEAIRPYGLTEEDIKVSVTPTNRKWSGERLYREVRKEHDFFRRS